MPVRLPLDRLTRGYMIEIRGTEQAYNWGGQHYISLITGSQKVTPEPVAELWFGDHPNGVARLGDGQPLDQWLAEQPEARLGEHSIERFGSRLPFLLKVLDVREPLSIQVHPTIEQARAGFQAEQGISIPAEQRNYKDANHKPELMLALSDFWLLHGFRTDDEIGELLSQTPCLQCLLPIYQEHGCRGLVEHLFQLPEAGLEPLIMPLVEQYQPEYDAGHLSKNNPYFWLIRAYNRAHSSQQPLEAGLLMVLLLNLAYCPRGGVIFQDAGIPHAYLEGQNLELMANSDNVLRAGLTSKHVDIQELLKVASFEPTQASLIEPVDVAGGRQYPVPVDDFCLTEFLLRPGEQLTLPTNPGPCIWFVFSGEMSLSTEPGFWHGGSAFYQPPGDTETVTAQTELLLYRASAKL